MEFRNNLVAYGECSESYGEQSCHGLLRELFYRLDIVDLQALPVDPILPMTWPIRTAWPTFTSIDDRCA